MFVQQISAELVVGKKEQEERILRLLEVLEKINIPSLVPGNQKGNTWTGMENEVKSVRARKGHSVYRKKIGKMRKHSTRFIGHKLQLTALDCTLCPGSVNTCQEENHSQLHRWLLTGALRAGMAICCSACSQPVMPLFPSVLVTLWESDLGSHATKDRVPSGGF